MNLQFISNEEAVERFCLDEHEPFGDMGFETVILLEGDTVIDGNLDTEWYEKLMEENDREPDQDLILVNGNLTVNGTVTPGGDGLPFLFVNGNITCDFLLSYDECICITGDADIKYAFYGEYNDGMIEICGKTRVPWLLNSDHYSQINHEGAITINCYSDYYDHFDYDFSRKDFIRAFRDEVLDFSDTDARIDVDKFLAILKSGETPLKPGAKTERMLISEEIDRIITDGLATEIDFSNKKLNDFPAGFTSLKNLRILNLAGNNIKILPDSLGDLVNLEELDISGNPVCLIPSTIGNLRHLKKLNLGNTVIEKLPESATQCPLKELILQECPLNMDAFVKVESLELLDLSGTTDDDPVDFPEAVCGLKNLKKLDISDTTFKELPDSFRELTNLEDLNLNRALQYIKELPDLSGLRSLNKVSVNGQIKSGILYPLINVIKPIFKVTSLKRLDIDRFGERTEELDDDDYAELLRDVENDPELSRIINGSFVKTIYDDGDEIWKGIVRPAPSYLDLEGIGALENLEFLDISFNGLKELPAEFSELKNLKFVDLQYNCLNLKKRLELKKQMPQTIFDFRFNKDDETEKGPEIQAFKTMQTLIKEANSAMARRNDFDSLVSAIEKYDAVLAMFSSGEVVDEYNHLYAHYGRLYSLTYILANCSGGLKKKEILENRHEQIKWGTKLMELVPGIIWHFTDIGQFHRECLRIAANSVAWQMYELCSDRENLEKALEIIDRGVEHIDNTSQYFIFDTKVRILLKLGMEQQAWEIVKICLKNDPDFQDFTDLRNDPRYIAWLEN
ncbi:leucine-rich repeat domain-containing protein [Myxococcota bacterium]|nr:leucine-rich repeat domain-containing protein [Myxococcota bacterium]MBU1382725.1 leucine-rich repeat domain-containing protein [Myxococcota bacterium]MBU1498398.1 leucine-rich repeat domain-containing protein [Myxococcota bacterium]